MKNVKVNDKTYTAVSTVELPLADGTGNAQFKDIDEIVEPSGTKSITTNGTHDVKDYASVNVNVAGGGESTQDQLVQYCNGAITDLDLTGATKIPPNMFRADYNGNSAITGITMPNVTEIGEYAFNKCKNLVLNELPSGITTIGNNAFTGCEKLAFTNIPAIRKLDNGTFQDCTQLNISELPEGTETVNNYTFSGCNSIAEMTFPSTLKDIGNNGFGSCTGLTKVTFKGTPTGTIHASAFASCDNLKDIYVPWAEGTKPNAPWGATNATIHYNSAV